MVWASLNFERLNSCFCTFSIYIKETTSSTVYMEFSSQFKNKMETTTTTRSAFFCAWLTLIPHSQPTPFLVICPKQEKKSNFQHISLSTRSKSYGFIFFKNFLGQQYKRFWGSLCFSLIHRKGTSSPTPYNIKRLQQPSNIVHKKKRDNTSITRWTIKNAFCGKACLNVRVLVWIIFLLTKT